METEISIYSNFKIFMEILDPDRTLFGNIVLGSKLDHLPQKFSCIFKCCRCGGILNKKRKIQTKNPTNLFYNPFHNIITKFPPSPHHLTQKISHCRIENT